MNHEFWIGSAGLLYNGWHAASALVTGSVGGFAALRNPDKLPSFASEPRTFLFFVAIYAALAGLGLVLVLRGWRATNRTS